MQTNSSLSARLTNLLSRPFFSCLAFALAGLTVLIGLIGWSPSVQAQGAPAASGTSSFSLIPEAPPSEVEQLESLIRARKNDEALQRADQILKKNPRNAQLRFMRAVLLNDLGQKDEAGAAFEALNQDFPELPEPYNNLAVLHAAAGRYEQARGLLLRALAVQPNYVTAQENLGDLYISMAAESYARGLQLDSGNALLKNKLSLTRDLNTKLRAQP